MFSRVTARVILDSAKRRVCIGSVPTKFRTIFSGAPNQQNYESKPIACPTIPPTFQSDDALEAVNIAIHQKNCESKPIASPIIPLAFQSENLHEEELADETRIFFFEFPHEYYRGFYLDEHIRNDTSQDPGDHIVQDPDDDHIVGANCCLSIVNFRLMRDVASEVVTLHQTGIIHGNINPHNIFIFRGKRLYAKLVDEDTSKWKAPEQLLNGSQTKASDMFNLGCVLYFCITKGRHPFGDTLDQCHDNLMENRKSLSRVKCYPEAFNLLSRLLNREPELRPNAMEVLSHPLFWNSEKRLSFLYCCSKQIECVIELYNSGQESEFKRFCSELLQDLERIAPMVMDEKWDEEIRSVRLSCSSEEVRSLLHFISETFAHSKLIPARIEEYPEELQPFGDSLKPHYRMLDEYLTGQYPWLLIYLYNFSLKHFGDCLWFSGVYCKRENDQRPFSGCEYIDISEAVALTVD